MRLTSDIFWPERKFSPSKFAGSGSIKKSHFGFWIFTTVSNIVRAPSCTNCPRECRSVENTIEAGNRPFLSLPSLSPNSCLYHSFIRAKAGS